MKCPKKDKNCSPSICFVTSKKNYICSGISSKPTKFEEDKIWLCLKGALSETSLEMTENEVLGIISVLTASLFGFKKLQIEVNKKESIYNDNDK